MVVPVYATEDNGRLDFLGQTLNSVERQTHHGTVGVVVDDGSSVDVQGFMIERGYKKSRYVRRERQPEDLKTASNAINVGLNLSLARSGDVFTSKEREELVAIGLVHSDDLVPYASVEKRLAQLGGTDSFVFGNVASIDSSERFLGASKWEGNLPLLQGAYFPNHTIIWTLPFLQKLQKMSPR